MCGALIEGESATMPEFSACHVSPLNEDKPKVQSEFSRTYYLSAVAQTHPFGFKHGLGADS